LTVTLPANAPTGSFTLTITAQAGGLTRLATAILTVTAAPQTQTQTLTPTTTATTESIMDLLQQNSLLLIGVLAVVIVALLAVLLRRPKAPSQPKPQEPARFCATCGKPLTYVTEYSRWYCRNCKEYR
jgi:NADH pyrophosphatase NudC (nudix superfamily)